MMKLVKLSDTDLFISEVGLGCMSLKGDLKHDQSIIFKALDCGINFLDTADLYQSGLNETVIGAAIQGKRNQVVLATKGGNQLSKDGQTWTWNPRKSSIMHAVEESLKRLKTDYIDLYQLHGGTIEDPFEEIFEAFEMLKSQGKIRAFGISSIRPNVIRKVSKMNGLATLMSSYSPLDRRPEEEIFDLAKTANLGVLIRGVFAKGALIKKSNAGFLNFSALEVQDFHTKIHDYGFRAEAILIRFGLSPPAVTALIIGASSLVQMEKIIGGYAESFSISTAIIDQIKSKFPAEKYDLHRS